MNPSTKTIREILEHLMNRDFGDEFTYTHSLSRAEAIKAEEIQKALKELSELVERERKKPHLWRSASNTKEDIQKYYLELGFNSCIDRIKEMME